MTGVSCVMAIFYKNIQGILCYWETWENSDGQSATVHYGQVGEEGITEIISSDHNYSHMTKVIEKINHLDGYKEINIDNFQILIIEYIIQGFGKEEDLQKRHSLEDEMQEILGWTGLGFCDGGSVGSDSMEVCCLVVDFEIAKKVIEQNLKGTKYEDYKRIYLEE